MTPKDIKIQMIRVDITPAEVARQLNVTPQAVSQVIYGKTVSSRIQAAVAMAVGRPVCEMWPPKYQVYP